MKSEKGRGNAHCILFVLWSLVFRLLTGSMKQKLLLVSSLVKSRSRVELNSTGSYRLVLSFATSGNLDASLGWLRHTQMGTFEGNTSPKMTSVSNQEC